MLPPLTPSQQVRILKWARERGLLTPEESGLAMLPDDATLSELDLAERFTALQAQGRLEGLVEAALAADRADTAVASSGNDWLEALGKAAEALGPEALEGFVLPRDGRYLPLEYLGDGGMGHVYKAFDQQLERVVALKFLKRLERGPLDRFMQEGRAQARIEHPHICHVYSVDAFEGKPYLSMRFINGPTLKAALPRLTLEQKMRILVQVAQALHACHREGIIHRDLKPTNIMLELREDGGWWPYLMDFGLARELGDGSTTLPGMMLGTPVYCSPEQVQGRMGDVDRRSDVYSLGATLYECLCGQPPFPSRGTLVDLVQRISEEDPEPPRRRHPALPRDLQTIVLKALEKDPRRRYPSARALAEDLQRFLDGDPILAHGARPGYRLLKHFRKNRALALAATGALLVMAAFAAFGAAMAWRGRVMGQSFLEFGREAEYMEGLLLKAYTLPLHDVGTERALVQQHLDHLNASLPAMGRWSRPAAHLALGRGYLALDQLEEARRELELASGTAPQDPDNALALGLTLTRLYQADLEGLRGKALADRKQELDPSLRQPALACLRRAQGAHQDGPAFVEAVLALVEERYPDAIRLAQDYQRLAPWAYEAWLLEADAHRALAAGSIDQGDFPRAETSLERAGRALRQAQDVARSAPLAYLGEVQRRMLVYQMRLDRGQGTEADRDWALEATTLCLTADPGNWKALSYRAAILRRWGAVLLARGQDPGASLEAAIASAEEGLRRRPDDNPLWNNLGTCLRNKAEWEFSRGLDPTPTLARAVAALTRALDRPQFKDWLLDAIGNCHELRARHQLEHGEDPTGAVRAAVDCLDQASALKPWVGHATTKGGAFMSQAAYLELTGKDPGPAFDAARQAYAEALRLNAHSYQARMAMAGLLLARAEEALDRSASPGGDLREAMAHLDAALDLNPRLGPEGYPAKARCLALEGLAAPASPARTRALAEARATLAKARAFAGERPDTALPVAQVWLLLARAEPRSAAAANGLAALAPAVARRPWDAEAVYTRGRLLALLGRRAEADRDFARAVTLNANLARVAKTRLPG